MYVSERHKAETSIVCNVVMELLGIELIRPTNYLPIKPYM